MGDPISFSVEDMEQRRRRTSAARKASMRPPSPPKAESEALAAINEIFNPSFKKPVTKGTYHAPDEVAAGDFEGIKDLDIKKVAELKEVFLLLDLDSDGLISKDDLRFTFTALGTDTPDEQIEEMLKEAKDPLDYEAFIELMSHRTVELDPEDVLLEAWSKWDDYGTGKIEEKKMYEELTNYGDVMTSTEANEALKYAPIAKAKTLEEPPMIDYPAFCRILSGMRKRKPRAGEE
ncbi:myosin regulatory light chain LC-2, mantle muscle [Anastrepha ludens]|uniref:myosin regulatory light chain LC-2, mantle muscle n=1 Tax=Anastrepha ludens TaxID=28586 RepID=UPI0023B00341|nr:myosin regulatory light chain LC-2, mantle muscle [Anastrepha ludens]